MGIVYCTSFIILTNLLNGSHVELYILSFDVIYKHICYFHNILHALNHTVVINFTIVISMAPK